MLEKAAETKQKDDDSNDEDLASSEENDTTTATEEVSDEGFFETGDNSNAYNHFKKLLR